MEATVIVCLVTAIACALLTLDGAGATNAGSSSSYYNDERRTD